MPHAKRPALPPSLAVWTGYLLSRAAQQCQELFEALMEPDRIRGRHFRVLAVLGEGESLSQLEIGERVGIDRNTMVLLLDDLEGRGLVTRRRDPEDRRAHRVSLTRAGGRSGAGDGDGPAHRRRSVRAALARRARPAPYITQRPVLG